MKGVLVNVNKTLLKKVLFAHKFGRNRILIYWSGMNPVNLFAKLPKDYQKHKILIRCTIF